MMPIEQQLATLVIATLDKQGEFFKGRDRAVLAECKVLERQLRLLADSIINPPKQSSLI